MKLWFGSLYPQSYKQANLRFLFGQSQTVCKQLLCTPVLKIGLHKLRRMKVIVLPRILTGIYELPEIRIME